MTVDNLDHHKQGTKHCHSQVKPLLFWLSHCCNNCLQSRKAAGWMRKSPHALLCFVSHVSNQCLSKSTHKKTPVLQSSHWLIGLLQLCHVNFLQKTRVFTKETPMLPSSHPMIESVMVPKLIADISNMSHSAVSIVIHIKPQKF